MGGVCPRGLPRGGVCLGEGCVSQHALGRGCLPGVCVSQHALGRRCLLGGFLPGGCLSAQKGVSAWGGVYWGVSAWECVSQHALGRGVAALGGVWPGGVCIPVCTRQGSVYPGMHWAWDRILDTRL